MTVTDIADSLPPVLRDQPIERVTRDGVAYVVLGTAHVSRASVEAVDALLAHETFDAVAVELCDSRAQGMRDPDAFKQMDLFQVIRQGKAGMVAASLVLSSFQKRLAEQYGIQPGAEMKAAMDGADQRALPLWLVDREVGTTLRRAWHSVGFWQRFGLLGGLIASVFEREAIEETEIEKLKQGDMLESAFSEFASESAPLFRSLIAERDAYMAARLREQSTRAGFGEGRRVLVVIGAGHLEGPCASCFARRRAIPPRKPPNCASTPRKSRWPKWVALGLVLAVFAAIGFAFHRDTALGAAALRDWVLLTGGFAVARRGHRGSSPTKHAFGVYCCADQTIPARHSFRRYQRHGGSLGSSSARGRLRDLARRHRPLARLVEEPRRAHAAQFLPGQPRHHRR